MIRKLRLRYLITNMAILSLTLLVGLSVLFGVLYHTEVSSSYSVMQEMMQENNVPGRQFDAPPKSSPENEMPPDDAPENGLPPEYASPSVMTDQPQLALLNQEYASADESPDLACGGGQDSEKADTGNQNENAYDPYAAWMDFWKNYAASDYVRPPFWDFRDPRNPGDSWCDPWRDPHREDDKASDDDADDSESKESEVQQDPFLNPGWNPWEHREDPGIQPPEPPQTSAEPARTEPQESRTMPASASSEPPRQSEPSRSEKRDTAPPLASSVSTETTTVTAMTQPVSTVASSVASTAAAPVVTAVTTDAVQTTFAETSTTASQLVPVDEGKFVPDAYIANIGDDGKIESYAGNGSDPSDETHFRRINRAMDAVEKSGAESGTIEIDDKPFRYLYQKDENGAAHLVLLDRTLEISTLSRLLLIFFIITVIGLIGMFFLSMLLANWTVTPVAAAWEKQKQFVADASHELKTPLAVISANTEVVLSNPQESVAQSGKWLSYIQSETMRMSKLISNLLSVARMDQDNSHVSAEKISLTELVSNICMVFDPIIFEHGKTLSTVIQKNVFMRAEEDNVRQLLSILLDNAVLHSVPHAQITVSLSQDAQGKIRIAVANTAKDIPKDQLSHLFDRFYRVDTEGNPNGSGLGLSIAKSIVHQMGGTLTVTSENHLVTFLALFS